MAEQVDQYSADLDALTAKASPPAASGGKINPEKSIADLVGQLREVNRQEESDPDIAKTRKQLASDTEALDAKQAGVKPFDVKPWDADKEKAKRTTDPIEAFGSFGSIFGILASAFTHRPMINSLNAAAAAMNAVKANDHEAYKSAFDAWKENTQLALDRHRVEHEDFSDALSKLSTDASLMKVYAAKYGDKKAELLSEAGLYEHLATYAQAKENAAMQLATYAPQIEKWGIQKGDVMRLDAARKSGDPTKIAEAEKIARDHQEIFAPRPRAGAGVTLASEKARLVEDIIAEKSAEKGSPLTATERMQIMKQALAPGLTGNATDRLQAHVDLYDFSLDKLDDTLKVLDTHIGAAGVAGKALRLKERIGDIFGSNETDRVQFMRNIDYLKSLAPTLLLDRAGRPLSSEASRIDDIIGGLSLGDTTANTIRSLEEVKKLYQQMRTNTLSRVEGGWKPSEERTPAPGGGKLGETAAPGDGKAASPWANDPVVE